MPLSALPFPALDSGMLAQLPVELTIEKITRSTRFADGSVLTSAYDARLRYAWTLRYANLNSSEWQRLNDFIDAQGRGASSFAFPDPTGNLLAHSGNLEHAIWLTPSGLTVDPFEDPDQHKAFIVTNSTPQTLTLTQSINLAGGFYTCFSILAKWEGGSGFALSLADNAGTTSQSHNALGWRRHSVHISGASNATTRTVGITFPANTQIIVACPQLEIAASPGAYLETGALGAIFPNAWLAQQSYESQSNAPGAHSITLRIESLRAL